MASKRRLRRNSCQGKVRYPDQTAAVRVLIGINRDFNRSGLPRFGRLRSYPCKFCGGWHLGHRSDSPAWRRP